MLQLHRAALGHVDMPVQPRVGQGACAQQPQMAQQGVQRRSQRMAGAVQEAVLGGAGLVQRLPDAVALADVPRSTSASSPSMPTGSRARCAHRARLPAVPPRRFKFHPTDCAAACGLFWSIGQGAGGLRTFFVNRTRCRWFEMWGNWQRTASARTATVALSCRMPTSSSRGAQVVAANPSCTEQ